MGSSIVTRPTLEPVSVSQARDHLRIDTTEADSMIASYIVAAREWCESRTRRALPTQTWEYTIDFDWPLVDGLHRIELPLAPVSSVSLITYLDEDGAEQTLSESLYQVCGTGADNHRPYIVPAYNQSWPTVRYVPEVITVEYVAGYGAPWAVPGPLKTAMLLHIEYLFDRSSADRGALEAARDALIDPYRIVKL
jgi:uncharacterized phiE125 gp8 family phage protein